MFLRDVRRTRWRRSHNGLISHLFEAARTQGADRRRRCGRRRENSCGVASRPGAAYTQEAGAGVWAGIRILGCMAGTHSRRITESPAAQRDQKAIAAPAGRKRAATPSRKKECRPVRGKVYIVGAGPGAADL